MEGAYFGVKVCGGVGKNALDCCCPCADGTDDQVTSAMHPRGFVAFIILLKFKCERDVGGLWEVWEEM